MQVPIPFPETLAEEPSIAHPQALALPLGRAALWPKILNPLLSKTGSLTLLVKDSTHQALLQQHLTQCDLQGQVTVKLRHQWLDALAGVLAKKSTPEETTAPKTLSPSWTGWLLDEALYQTVPQHSRLWATLQADRSRQATTANSTNPIISPTLGATVVETLTTLIHQTPELFRNGLDFSSPPNHACPPETLQLFQSLAHVHQQLTQAGFQAPYERDLAVYQALSADPPYLTQLSQAWPEPLKVVACVDIQTWSPLEQALFKTLNDHGLSQLTPLRLTSVTESLEADKSLPTSLLVVHGGTPGNHLQAVWDWFESMAQSGVPYASMTLITEDLVEPPESSAPLDPSMGLAMVLDPWLKATLSLLPTLSSQSDKAPSPKTLLDQHEGLLWWLNLTQALALRLQTSALDQNPTPLDALLPNHLPSWLTPDALSLWQSALEAANTEGISLLSFQSPPARISSIPEAQPLTLLSGWARHWQEQQHFPSLIEQLSLWLETLPPEGQEAYAWQQTLQALLQPWVHRCQTVINQWRLLHPTQGSPSLNTLANGWQTLGLSLWALVGDPLGRPSDVTCLTGQSILSDALWTTPPRVVACVDLTLTTVRALAHRAPELFGPPHPPPDISPIARPAEALDQWLSLALGLPKPALPKPVESAPLNPLTWSGTLQGCWVGYTKTFIPIFNALTEAWQTTSPDSLLQIAMAHATQLTDLSLTNNPTQATAKEKTTSSMSSPSHHPWALLTNQPADRPVLDCLEQLTLSPSAIDTYVKCPRQFYYKSLLRVSTPTNAAALRGQWLHWALAQYHGLCHPPLQTQSNKVSPFDATTLTILSKQSGQPLLETLITRLPGLLNSPDPESANLAQSLNALDPMTVALMKTQLLAISKAMSESGFFEATPRQVLAELALQPWSIPQISLPDGRPVTFKGRVDAVVEHQEGAWKIVDYKTFGRSKFADSKSETSQRKLLQACTPINPDVKLSHRQRFLAHPYWMSQVPLYALGVPHTLQRRWSESSINISHVGLSILRTKHPEDKAQYGPVEVMVDQETLKQGLTTFLDNLQHGVLSPLAQASTFETNPSECKTCDFVTLCEGAATDEGPEEEGGDDDES